MDVGRTKPLDFYRSLEKGALYTGGEVDKGIPTLLSSQLGTDLRPLRNSLPSCLLTLEQSINKYTKDCDIKKSLMKTLLLPDS